MTIHSKRWNTGPTKKQTKNILNSHMVCKTISCFHQLLQDATRIYCQVAALGPLTTFGSTVNASIETDMAAMVPSVVNCWCSWRSCAAWDMLPEFKALIGRVGCKLCIRCIICQEREVSKAFPSSFCGPSFSIRGHCKNKEHLHGLQRT